MKKICIKTGKWKNVNNFRNSSTNTKYGEIFELKEITKPDNTYTEDCYIIQDYSRYKDSHYFSPKYNAVFNRKAFIPYTLLNRILVFFHIPKYKYNDKN